MSGSRSSRSKRIKEWSSSDYSTNIGFPDGTDYLQPNLIFNSPLATNGPLFKSDNDTMQKYNPSVVGTPPIPGKYPYNKDWNSWGGDSKYLIGDSYYTSFITSFGLVGVTTTQAYYASGGHNKIAKAKLRRLADGSQLIFNWFAGLIDGNGKPIRKNDNPSVKNLKGMLNMLINGDQPIDPKKLLAQLNQFAANNAELKYYITSLKEYLDKVLLGRIEIIPWQEMISRRQKGMLYMYKWFELFRENPTEYKLQINEYIRDFFDTANQMAAFFGIMIHLEMMLDTMLDQMKHGGFVIQPSKRHDILENITSNLLWLFMVNTILYRDLANLYTVGGDELDSDTILQIEITQIDYCDMLSSILGLIFAIFDALVRGRNLYDAF